MVAPLSPRTARARRLDLARAWVVGLGVALASPAMAHADGGTEDARPKRGIPYKAVETQAVMVGQLLPTPSFGFDGAFVLGTETFQFRVGAMLLGAPPFRLGEGKIANVLGVGQADLCVAKNVYRSQIRMCMGGQGGVMAHRWIDYERAGRGSTPWWAGTLKGDYRYAVTERFGVMGGVGVVVPVMGPSFRAYDQYGSPTPLVFPGPVGASINVGTSYRF